MLTKLVKTKRYRVEVAVSLFNCVTDIENFSLKLWECARAVNTPHPSVDAHLAMMPGIFLT